MSLIGADTMPDAYKPIASRPREPAADDRSPSATRLRSMVMSHREWILTHRIRAGVAISWREFFRECDVVLCPGATPRSARS